jgi:hypothetical protein
MVPLSHGQLRAESPNCMNCRTARQVATELRTPRSMTGTPETTRACTHKISNADSDLIKVRFGALSGLKRDISRGPLRANFRLMHRSKQHLYSITSSASWSTDRGTSTPIALAVLRLTTSSNFVGCSTGRSPAFAPFAILSTYSAARRNMAGKFTP